MIDPVAYDEQRHDSYQYFEPNTYWVEVLLEDGEQYGAVVEGYDEEEAFQNAEQDAREHGLRPVSIVEWSLEREGCKA